MSSNQKSEYTDNNIIYNIIDKYIIQPFKYYGKDFLNHPDEKDIESNSDNQNSSCIDYTEFILCESCLNIAQNYGPYIEDRFTMYCYSIKDNKPCYKTIKSIYMPPEMDGMYCEFCGTFFNE